MKGGSDSTPTRGPEHSCEGGERVKRAQAMALVGNSGTSAQLHLHFHVVDANSPLGAEGLPYVLDAWRDEIPIANARGNFWAGTA